MITTFDARRLEPPPSGSVVSIGVFDGLHVGHQATLRANVARARSLGAQAAVVTFRRHPKIVLLGHAPRTITALEHRIELFRRAGIDHVVALAFDEALREMSAEDFVAEYLVRGLAARAFVLGFDSKFGKDRRGGADLLRAMGFAVEVVPEVRVAGRAVSSTAIREAIELGDLAAASAMLGRPVSILGRVVRGDGRGRTLGFPTANLELHGELCPPVGVYAARARWSDASGERTAPAVVNVGFRPTVAERPASAPLVEAHLLDCAVDLYGQALELEFHARLRDEQRFADPGALAAQIARDVGAARHLLSAHEAPAVDDLRERGENAPPSTIRRR